MRKDYFAYLMKSRKTAFVFFFAVYFAAGVSPLVLNRYTGMSECLEICWILSIAISFVLPLFEFSFVHKRKTVDQYFSLPIDRKDMLISELLFMVLMATGYFVVTSLVIFAINGTINGLPEFLILELYSIVSIAILLIIHTAIYLFANNIFDGVVILGAYTFLFLLIDVTLAFGVSLLSAGGLNDEMMSVALNFSAAGLIGTNGICFIEHINSASLYMPAIETIVLPLFYCGIALYCLKKNFIERKAERAEQLSDAFPAYPFIITAYTSGVIFVLCCAMISGNGYGILYWILLFFIYVAAEFIYLRKIQITKTLIIRFALIAMICCTAAFTGWNTHGFGLADSYNILAGNQLAYSYYEQVNPDDLSDWVLTSGNSEGIESGNYVEVSFFIGIPLDQRDRYEEVIQVLEKNRERAIDDFYSRSKTNVNGYFTITNYRVNHNDEELLQSRGYQPSVLFTEDELKIIDQYTDVTVTVYEDGLGVEMPLQQYLKERGE